MIKRAYFTFFIVAVVSIAAFAQERPVVNIPPSMRQENWIGNEGSGSCVWASLIPLFRWQGRNDIADYVRKYYGNGEWADDVEQKLNRAGVRFAYITNGDVKFLEWACKTRRGCGIVVMGGMHMVTLVHFDDTWAAILDNNQIDKFIWIPREQLVTVWKNSHGWAVTPVYVPAAPLPK